MHEPNYRSSDPDFDPHLAAAIEASLQMSRLQDDDSQIAAAIAESKNIAESSSFVTPTTFASTSTSASTEPAFEDSSDAGAAMISNPVNRAEEESGVDSLTTLPSAHFTMSNLKQNGLKVVGSLKQLPAGIMRGNTDVRNGFRMIDVEPDGNCGAYTLSLVNFAVNNTILSATNIRNKLIELVQNKIHSNLYTKYIDATLEQRDGSVRYIEQPEIAMFCEWLNVNCIVFGLLPNGRSQNYNPYVHVMNPTLPYAVFVNTQRGNHYELLVKLSERGNFALLLNSKDAEQVLKIQADIIRQPPIESPPSIWFEHFGIFVNDDGSFTEDLTFTEASKSKKQKM